MKQILYNEIARERCNQRALDAFNSSISSPIDAKDVTVKDVYNSISGISANTNAISSLGDYASNISQQVAESEVNRIRDYLPKDSLAHKILTDDKNFNLRTGYQFTDKQKWVIAYELQKNKDYLKEAKSSKDKISRETNRLKAKIEESKNKIKANKEASATHTSKIKESGKNLTDYYKWLNTRGNQYRSEAFSKKYSKDSVNAFLNR